MSRSRTIHRGRTIILAVLMASAATGCASTSAAPSRERSASVTAAANAVGRSLTESEVSGLIANARVAQRQHDSRSLRRFQTSLIEIVGLATISAARAKYTRALAGLATATSMGDSHARARLRAELRALCEPDGLVAAFEPCDAHIVVWGS
jgi:hypothetical protein